MEKKKYGIVKVQKRISACRRRLDNLKKQGFHFSQNIYNDLDDVKSKILQTSFIYRLWNRKTPILLMGVGFFVAFFVVWGLIGPPETQLKINVTNLVDGEIIHGNYLINGTASSSNGYIRELKVNIDYLDENTWEKAELWKSDNGTYFWNYTLDGYDLTIGNHTLFFRCYSGEKLSTKNCTIEKGDNRPIIKIDNSDESWYVSNCFNITGNSAARYGEIERVEIQFKNKDWITANGKTDWYYNWNTTTFKNGVAEITVRCLDTQGIYSVEHNLFVYVNNDDSNGKNHTIKVPTGGLFNLYFFADLDSMIPGETYTLEIYHRRQKENVVFLDSNTIKTIFNVNKNKNEYLEISITNLSIITPPDGELYSYVINVTISEKAPSNEISQFTISYSYGLINCIDVLNFLDRNPILNNILKNGFEKLGWLGDGTDDIQYSTGKW